MAVIRDMMPVFELFQPASIDDALALLNEHKADVWVLGGGMDSFDWLKDRTKRVSTVVDLSQISDLRGIKEVNGGLEIGAMTTLTDRMDAERGQAALLRRIAEGQEKLIEALQAGEGGGGSDPESRMRLRSIDVQLLRILEEMSAGRQETLTDLKTDIAALTAAIRQMSRSAGRA